MPMRRPVNDRRIILQKPPVSLQRCGMAEHSLVQDLFGVDVRHALKADVHESRLLEKIRHDLVHLEGDEQGILQSLHVFIDSAAL